MPSVLPTFSFSGSKFSNLSLGFTVDIPSPFRKLKISLYVFGGFCNGVNPVANIDSTYFNSSLSTLNAQMLLVSGTNNLVGLQSPPVSLSNGLYPQPIYSSIPMYYGLDSTWRSLAMVGDVNGDNVGDIAIGDPSSSQVYLFFGSKQTGYVNMMRRILIFGKEGDNTGFAVSTAGDVNGDGFTDLLIGIPYYVDSTSGVHGGCVVLYGNRAMTNNIYK
jgi:hypothetical protein